MNIPSKTPFGRYLADQDLNINEMPANWRAFARRLRNTPERIGPNTPSLVAFAKVIDRPLADLQKFATGEPLSDKWIQKIQTQIENGNRNTGGSGSNKKAAKKSHGGATYAKHKLAKLVAEKGLTLAEVTKKAGLPMSAGWRASVGKMPPNHPQLKRLAAAIGVSAATVAAMQTVPPLDHEYLARAERSLAKGGRKRASKSRRKGIVLASVAVDKKERPEIHTNGKALAGGATKYNRLRKLEVRVRESVRAMIATLNVTVMRGETHMPPIPAEDLYLILQDYLEEKGITPDVLVNPKFVTLFDPR